MSETNFDDYVTQYRDIINKVSSISGEQFEYFIQLRLGLMKERLVEKGSRGGNLKILDFGCGTGTTEIYLKDLYPEAEIYGIDSSAESICTAYKINLAGVTFIHSAEMQLPFPDEFFDIIYSNGTYHHIDSVQQKDFINEMYRMCRHDGDLFIFENNPKNPLMMRAMRNNPFDDGATAVGPSSLKKMATIAGFDCKDICYYFFFPRFLGLLRFTEKWLRKIPVGAQYYLWASKQ